MIKEIKDYVKTKPRVYDIAIRIRRATGMKSPSYDCLNNFSKAHDRNVSFIQIGANDGLRNDPIREFVIRDRWAGILVEPLPYVFDQLKDNYRRLKGSHLVFVNAAISTSNSDEISFWTFDETFLATLSLEERMYYLRKASCNVENLKTFFKSSYDFEQAVKKIRVPCLTLSYLVEKYWTRGKVDLLVIDAEGHESSIIPSIDFDVLNPEAIFFESHLLGRDKEELFDFLCKNNYKVSEVGGDAIAVRSSLPMDCRRCADARR